MLEIITIVAPVFLLMVLGYGFGRTKLFPEGSSTVLIAYVWNIAIPALLFSAIAPRELPGLEQITYIGSYYLSVYAIYIAAVYLSRWMFKLTLAEQGVFAFATVFGNVGFIGIPIVEGAYGEEGLRFLLMLMSFHSFTLIPVTTILVERAKNVAGGAGMMQRTFASIRQNPIILSLFFSLLWSAFGMPFPYWLERLFELPAQSAAPVGLFAGGLALSRVKIAGDMLHSVAAVVFKLVMLPLAVFSITNFVLEMPNIMVAVATIMAAMPTGMIVYSFGAQQQVGARRAATAVLISTACSFLTIFLILAFLREQGMVPV